MTPLPPVTNQWVDAPDKSQEWRDEIRHATGWVSAQQNAMLPSYEQDKRWKDKAVPVPIIEAVMSRESGGVNIECNQWGACGLMQIVPSGQEASWWKEWTGQTPTSALLTKNPETNIRIGTYGLGKRFFDVCARNPKACDWYSAALAYFGCYPLGDGSPNPNCGDAYNSAVDYRDYIVEYVRESYGEDVAQKLANGEWQDYNVNDGLIEGVWKALSNTVGNTVDCVTDPGKCIEGALSGIIGGFITLIGKNLPRIGIAILGIGILGIGTFGIIRE